MAEIPYSAGGPSVQPDTRLPDDYLHVEANPAAFGGLIAKGAQEFGQGASQAGKFFGQAAADDQTNQYQKSVDTLVYGDPSKSITGPDGKPQPDLGFLGLKGRAALDARPQLEAQIDALAKQSRETLLTPESQLYFDQYTRRSRMILSSEIGRHAEQQQAVWFGDVNASSQQNAVNRIARNPDNPTEVASGASDLIDAEVKQANIVGAVPGDSLYTAAVARGKQKALKAQVEAIGATDPARAMKITTANKDIAGADFEPLMQQFRARGEEQQGIAVGSQVLTNTRSKYAYSNPNMPIYAQAAEAIPGGYSARGAARTVQIESSGNPNATNGHMQGLTQFSPATWKEYGEGSPFDPQQAVLAAQRYAAANRPVLAEALGRQPTDAELYIAHQQGPGGAVSLLTHPNTRAGDLVGDAEIKANGGDPDAPASAFVKLWAGKFNGGSSATMPGGVTSMVMPPEATGLPQVPGPETPPGAPGATAAFAQPPEGVMMPGTTVPGQVAPPAPVPMRNAPENVQSQAYSTILNDPTLSPAVKQHALRYIQQTLAAQEVADAGSQKVIKQQNDQAADGYVTKILTGDVSGITDQIAHDPKLTWETKLALADAALHAVGGEEAEATKMYGKGFYQKYVAITAPMDDPSRIGDPNVILRAAAPGGDLTLAGAQKLRQVMSEVQKSTDGQAEHTAKVGLLTYAKGKLSFDQTMLFPGLKPLEDPKGAQIFNAQFIPKFESAYEKWTQAGKDPWQFLTQENVDKLMTGMRSSTEMAAAKISAEGGAVANVPIQSQGGAPITAAEMPAAPAKVPANAWGGVMTLRPTLANGVMPLDLWGRIISKLYANPTPAYIKQFNESKFGKAGYQAETILQQLGVPGIVVPPSPLPPAPEPFAARFGDSVR